MIDPISSKSPSPHPTGGDHDPFKQINKKAKVLKELFDQSVEKYLSNHDEDEWNKAMAQFKSKWDELKRDIDKNRHLASPESSFFMKVIIYDIQKIIDLIPLQRDPRLNDCYCIKGLKKLLDSFLDFKMSDTAGFPSIAPIAPGDIDPIDPAELDPMTGTGGMAGPGIAGGTTSAADPSLDPSVPHPGVEGRARKEGEGPKPSS